MAHAQSNDESDKPTGFPFALSWDKLFTGVSKIKLPGGIVGKLSTVLIVFASAVAAVCWSFPNIYVALAGLAAILIAVLVLGMRMLNFAEKNPYAAMLEGAELLIHQQIQLGMKGAPVLQYDPDKATTDPSLPPVGETTIEEVNKPDEMPPRIAERTRREGGGNG